LHVAEYSSISAVSSSVDSSPVRYAPLIRRLVNGGGGWTHPVHIHLVDSHILNRYDGYRYEWANQLKKR